MTTGQNGLTYADAGVDIIIAQGGEAGGHSGEVGSIVLWPQVVKAVAPVPTAVQKKQLGADLTIAFICFMASAPRRSSWLCSGWLRWPPRWCWRRCRRRPRPPPRPA